MTDPRTRSRGRRSRKARSGCSGHPIHAGELYIEHVEFPGGESGYADSAGHPVRMAECRECAERYGRGDLILAREAADLASQRNVIGERRKLSANRSARINGIDY